MKRQVESIGTTRAILGEGPCWHKQTQKLFWLDIKGKQLFSYALADGKQSTWTLPLCVGSIVIPPSDWRRPDSLSGQVFLSGTENGFAWLCIENQTIEIIEISNPESHLPGNRFNDGKLGPDGRFYAGTMDNAEQEATGSLYALDSRLKTLTLDTGYQVTNGPAFSPDGNFLYHSDSARQVIYRFKRNDDGSLGDKTPFKQFGTGDGYPDGMTTDRQGNLWVAIWDGWRIEIINPSGQTIDSIDMPAARITSCTFAGDNEDILFATSASFQIPAETQPLAGSLFKIIKG